MEETSEYRSTINKLEVGVHTGGDISPDLQGFIFHYYQGYISSFFGFSRCSCSFFIDYLIIYLVFDTVKIRKLNVCFIVLQSLTSYLFKHLLTKTGLFTPLCLMFNNHILSLKVVSLFQSFMVITVVKNI